MSRSAESTQTRLAYQPALDGLRGAAVAMVVVFHGGFGWMSGGYVGVSVFFTLSGYLITALLIAEHDRTGRVSLAGFYGRRCKRLLPASLLTLAAVAVIGAAGGFSGVAGLRRDLLGSLFQVENWVNLLGHGSYADLTSAVRGRIGPLEHYWSLAIEEQFYWVWPVAMLALLRLVRRPGRRAVVLGALLLAGITAGFVIAAGWGADAAYWATPARLGEILAGAAVAGILAWRPALPTSTRWLCLPAVAVIAWAATSWPAAGGPASRGWLPVFALATAALLVGLQQPSAARRVLSAPPLVWLGSVSYGVYLFHWPIKAWLVDARTGLTQLELFAVEVPITLALAGLSAVVVERPVRGWAPHRFVPLASSATAMVALAALIVGVVAVPGAAHTSAGAGITPVPGPLRPVAVLAPVPATLPANGDTTASGASSTAPPRGLAGTPPSTGPVTVPAAATVTPPTSTDQPVPVSVPAAVTAVATTDAGPSTAAPATVPALTRPVRILVVGDSTAEATGDGLVLWADDHPDLAQVTNHGLPGCGFLLDGDVPTDGGMPWKSKCRALLERQLPADVARLQPDVVMLMVTLRDAEDHVFPGGSTAQDPTDEEFRARLVIAYTAVATRLRDLGVAHVVWVLAPFPTAPFAGAQRGLRDPARYDVLHSVIREVAAADPGRIEVVDLDGWMRTLGLLNDERIRGDGLHFTPEAAQALSQAYLGPMFVAVAVGAPVPPLPAAWPGSPPPAPSPDPPAPALDPPAPTARAPSSGWISGESTTAEASSSTTTSSP